MYEDFWSLMKTVIP